MTDTLVIKAIYPSTANFLKVRMKYTITYLIQKSQIRYGIFSDYSKRNKIQVWN